MQHFSLGEKHGNKGAENEGAFCLFSKNLLSLSLQFETVPRAALT